MQKIVMARVLRAIEMFWTFPVNKMKVQFHVEHIAARVSFDVCFTLLFFSFTQFAYANIPLESAV